ncbi:uncharacterized protein LOC125953379 [Anopheles darlingi]|uniref:uncharacterized protein LOC125953379 n=1 Tax=Anopheles darlingi TaxID=43151 RepID=UPI0021001CB2|nr:uncharacterized protein LOC125953379 [Anopheles darlingi]
MKEFCTLLNEIRNSTVMELSGDLNKVSLILNNTNRYVRSFDNIIFDGGNEPYIIEIVARLLRFLRRQNYLNEHNKVNEQYVTQLRQITMYLFLNTDVSFRYDLSRVVHVKHLLSTAPQLSKCLLLNCIWGLDLDRFLYEIVSNTPLWFSMQFLDQTISSLRYAKPYEVLERTESLVRSICLAIGRTDCDWQKIDRNRYVDHQRTLGKMCDHVAELLCFYNTPDSSKFQGWSKVRKHTYFGYVLWHLFKMVLTGLKLSDRRPQPKPLDGSMAMYELVIEPDRQNTPPTPPASALYSGPTEQALLKITTCLLNTLETCIMHVSIERFVCWADIDLFTNKETGTLQQLIGESAYRVSELLLSSKNNRQHSVLTHLAQFALRPRTLAEQASTMTLGQLMTKIEESATATQRMVYLNEFVKRGEQVLGNAECLAVLEQHKALLTGGHVRLMIEYDARDTVGDEMMDEDDVPDERVKLRELILLVVPNLPSRQFHSLVTFTIDTFGTDFDRYKQENFSSSLVAFINRMGSGPSDGAAGRTMQRNTGATLQLLIFQCPTTIFTSIVNFVYDLRGPGMEYYVDAIIAIIERQRPIAARYIWQHLESILVTDLNICKTNALKYFAQRIYEIELYEREAFFRQLLLRGIEKAYESKNLLALEELLSLFNSTWKKLLTVYRAPSKEMVRIVARETAVQLGQLTADLRAGLVNSNPKGINALSLAIELLVPTLSVLERLCNDADIENVQKVAKSEWPLATQYYFQVYLKPKPRTEDSEQKSKSFAEFLYDEVLVPKVSSDNAIRSFLVQILPQCVQSEVLFLAQDEMLRPQLFNAVETLLDEWLKRKEVEGNLHFPIHWLTNYNACLKLTFPSSDNVEPDQKCQNRTECLALKKAFLELMGRFGKNFDDNGEGNHQVYTLLATVEQELAMLEH